MCNPSHPDGKEPETYYREAIAQCAAMLAPEDEAIPRRRLSPIERAALWEVVEMGKHLSALETAVRGCGIVIGEGGVCCGDVVAGCIAMLCDPCDVSKESAIQALLGRTG